MSDEILVHFDSVCLSFDGKPILKNLSGKIPNLPKQGQVVALLGPSGIGKSCAFRICAGLQKPDSGGVYIGAVHEPVHRGMVGVVFQNYPLFEWRTVMGNLLTAAYQHHDNRKIAKERTKEVLERYQLTERANAYPSQLSGGQRQRVAIARQLLCSEHFLLMDEPFSGQDVLSKEKICTLIRERIAEDELNTFLITTHDIDSAISVADWIWLLGRDFDDRGNSLGARVQIEYDLNAMGLEWHPDIALTPEFSQCVRGIKERFRSL